jgi:hypothetical protein
MLERDEKIHSEFQSESLKEGAHLEDVGVNGEMILKHQRKIKCGMGFV